MQLTFAVFVIRQGSIFVYFGPNLNPVGFRLVNKVMTAHCYIHNVFCIIAIQIAKINMTTFLGVCRLELRSAYVVASLLKNTVKFNTCTQVILRKVESRLRDGKVLVEKLGF